MENIKLVKTINYDNNDENILSSDHVPLMNESTTGKSELIKDNSQSKKTVDLVKNDDDDDDYDLNSDNEKVYESLKYTYANGILYLDIHSGPWNSYYISFYLEYFDIKDYHYESCVLSTNFDNCDNIIVFDSTQLYEFIVKNEKSIESLDKDKTDNGSYPEFSKVKIIENYRKCNVVLEFELTLTKDYK